MPTAVNMKTKSYPVEHDTELIISRGRKITDTAWKPETIHWSTFLAELADGGKNRIKVTTEALHAMPKDQQAKLKDGKSFVGGEIDGGNRTKKNMRLSSMIILDVDDADYNVWDAHFYESDMACCVYSTLKHTPENPRLRILVPLDRHVTPQEREAVSRKISESFIDDIDDTTHQPHRLFYLPKVTKDGEYLFEVNDAPILCVDDVLDEYDNWRDPSEWAFPTGATIKPHTADKLKPDPREKDNIIGRFCRAYDVIDAIEEFLPDAYEEVVERERYSFLDGTSAGGVLIFDDGQFLQSFHNTDPTKGEQVHAFDLVRMHKFGHLDKDAKPDTPVNKLPSYKEMEKFASDSDGVLAQMYDLFDEFEVEDDPSPDKKQAKKEKVKKELAWRRKLERHIKTGDTEPRANNFKLILENDERLKDAIVFDLFQDRRLVARSLLDGKKLPKFRPFGNRDFSVITNYIDTAYRVTHKDLLKHAMNEQDERNGFHPVKDFFDTLEWDGVERLDTLFIDYLGADDNAYIRAVTRKSIVAAVTRVYEPGAKFDEMLTLAGKQGTGKSTILSKLGREWFNDSIKDVSGKNAMELLPGSLIIEMGELAAMKKADNEDFKQFLSKTEDIYRPAYAEFPVIRPRQCVFFGTSNSDAFLKDPTGDRRFWVVPIRAERRIKSVWDDFSDTEVRQVWAEALHRYREGERLQLDYETAVIGDAIKDDYRDEHPMAPAIRDFLDEKIPADWLTMSDDERDAWYAGEAFDDEAERDDLVTRWSTCQVEVWERVMRKPIQDMKKHDAQMIGDVIASTKGWERTSRRLRYSARYGQRRMLERAETTA